MAYRRGKSFSIYVPLRGGGGVIRGAGTQDRKIAEQMERAIKTLKDRREWDLLDALVTGGPSDDRGRKPRLSVGALYDAFAFNALDDLRAKLSDVDLEPRVADWQDVLVARFGKPRRAADTAHMYVAQVRTLIPAGTPYLRSSLTVEGINRWLSTPAMAKKNTGTRLRYHAALCSFCTYLVDIGVLSSSPMRDVKAPKASAARMRHLSGVDEMMRLINALPAPFNVISALAHCGIEIGAIVTIRRRDIDVRKRTIDIHGTKTASRRRPVRVTTFAWPLVESHIATLLPNALLFPGVTPNMTRKYHNRACEALQIEDYRVHDARHSFAVWFTKAGVPAEVIAKQLGHANTKMVTTVYGRFKVSADDTAAWFRHAETVDGAKPNPVEAAI